MLFALNNQRYNTRARNMDCDISAFVSNVNPPVYSGLYAKVQELVNLFEHRPSCVRELGFVG